MAIGTTAAIAGGLAAAGGIGKAISGGRQKRRFRQMIENYDMPELRNQAQDLTLNTYGYDLADQSRAAMTADLVDAMRQGGSRAIAGGGQQVVNAGNQMMQPYMMDLNNQAQRRQFEIMRDNQRIRNMNEQRALNDLAGMGAMYNAAQQDMWSGFGDISQAGMFAARNLTGPKTGPTPEVSKVMTGNFSQGYVPMGSMPFVSNNIAQGYQPMGGGITAPLYGE